MPKRPDVNLSDQISGVCLSNLLLRDEHRCKFRANPKGGRYRTQGIAPVMCEFARSPNFIKIRIKIQIWLSESQLGIGFATSGFAKRNTIFWIQP